MALYLISFVQTPNSDCFKAAGMVHIAIFVIVIKLYSTDQIISLLAFYLLIFQASNPDPP